MSDQPGSDRPGADPDIGYFGGGSAHAAAVPTTTAFEISGSTVAQSLGTCFGLVVRSMGMAKGITAGFRSMVGGEVKQYTQLLEDSRRHAMDRMVENAMLMGESPTAHADWSATDERFRDPSTGRLMRVWLDSSGTRHYVPD